MRSVSLLAILTVGALYAIDGDLFRPHGNPLVYALAVSWLISITVAALTSAIFSKMNPKLFPVAPFDLYPSCCSAGTVAVCVGC
jgi:hypothetical protein